METEKVFRNLWLFSCTITKGYVLNREASPCLKYNKDTFKNILI